MAKKYLSLEGLQEYDALLKGEIADSAESSLVSAKEYTDEACAAVKNNLLNGAGAAYDTLKELGDLIDDNQDAIGALETIAAGKADAAHTHDDLYYTKAEIDESLLQKSQVQIITWEVDD